MSAEESSEAQRGACSACDESYEVCVRSGRYCCSECKIQRAETHAGAR